MAIRIYTGIPGSGKTYRVVHELVKGDWAKGFFIVHNIDGLKADAVSSDGRCKTVEEVRAALGLADDVDFWTRPVQEELSQVIRAKYKLPLLIVCDESQQLFGKRGLTNERLEWLTYHRHLGQNIWLISQTIELLSRDVGDLAEVEIRARRGVVTSAFVYQWLCGGQGFKFDRKQTDPAVYAAYSSAQLHAGGTLKSPILWLALFGCLAFGGGVYAYGEKLKRPSQPVVSVAGKAAAKVEGPQTVPPVPVASSPVAPPVVAPVAPRAARPGPVRVVAPSGGANVGTPVEGKGGTPFEGWQFAGTINGVAYLAKGSDLVKASVVVGPQGYEVGGCDGVRRLLVLVHRDRGVVELRAGEGQWFGVDG